MNETTQDVQIGKLEVRVGNVEEKLKLLTENHLPHLQSKIDSVHDKQTYWGGALAVLIVLIPILIKFLFK